MALWYPLVMCLHALFVALTFVGLVLLAYWAMKNAKKETQEKCIKILLTFGIVGLIATTLLMGWAHTQGDFQGMHMQMFPQGNGGRDAMMNKDYMKRMPSMMPAITNSNAVPAVNLNLNTNR